MDWRTDDPLATEALDDDACYAALLARDTRFDGQFFTAVRTTGIFCRPICPARTPARRNVSFFRSAAAAQEAGFRPCLRCRPERAPGLNPMLFSEGLFRAALTRVNDGALDRQSADELADDLGITSRHLRRLFQDHLGTSPIAVATMRRALLAKQLLDDNDLPLTRIAFAAGFSSVRRFNDVMRAVYRDAPSMLRRLGDAAAGVGSGDATSAGAPIVAHVAYRSPYAWEHVLQFLSDRAFPGIESVGDGVYRRVFAAGDGIHADAIAVEHAPQRRALRVTGWLRDVRRLSDLLADVRRVFDVDADTVAIESHLRRDPAIAPAVRIEGLRVPGAWNDFEMAVRAVLGQRVTVKAATTLAARLIDRHGGSLDNRALPPGFAALNRTFPAPAGLAEADFRGIAGTRVQSEALRVLAARFVADPHLLKRGPDALAGIGGLGGWTRQYIAMRAGRDPDAFVEGDVAVLNAARDLWNCGGHAELNRSADLWRPWRAYAVMHLWHSSSGD
jgi:AraC family transcriptional regulator of adaptative response / DNA-3-methyladenine glycosylase II